MSKSFLRYYTHTIPAGRKLPLDYGGRWFVCKESSSAFQIAFDDGSENPCEVGLGFVLEDDDGLPSRFSKVTLVNTGGADVTVGFYVGNTRVIDSRLNTLVDRTVSVQSGTRDSYTKGTTLAGVGAFTGTNTDGKKRKSMYVFNNEAGGGATLLVTCANGITGFRIAPQTGIRIDAGGMISVSTGAADVMEVFEL